MNPLRCSVFIASSLISRCSFKVYNGHVNYIGGTNIIMENFDAESSLKFIEKYSVTIGQWVPTMFVKMFKLPEEVTIIILSSHKCAYSCRCTLSRKNKKNDDRMVGSNNS